MKLYLTSYRIPDLQVLIDLVGKTPGKTKLAIIPNAKDYYAPRARRVKIRDVQQALAAYGYKQTAIVDLEDFRGADKLKQELQKYDLLWVMGGNTFCLREAMRRSGFEEVIREVLAAGVIYAGESAGACVAGTDLRGVELADDPEFAEKTIWKGLSLTPYYFVPHADNRDLGPMIQPVIEERGHDLQTVVLNDNQAWVVNDEDAWKITGVKPEA